MRPDNDTDYWKRKYGPDERDVAFEMERERIENEPFERDYEEEAFNAAFVPDEGFVPDEDDDVDEARLARYDESG
jgi:hypothetical protein